MPQTTCGIFFIRIAGAGGRKSTGTPLGFKKGST
jgi:hypothetical protein